MRLVPKKKEILILPFLIRFAYKDVGRPDFFISILEYLLFRCVFPPYSIKVFGILQQEVKNSEVTTKKASSQ